MPGGYACEVTSCKHCVLNTIRCCKVHRRSLGLAENVYIVSLQQGSQMFLDLSNITASGLDPSILYHHNFHPERQTTAQRKVLVDCLPREDQRMHVKQVSTPSEGLAWKRNSASSLSCWVRSEHTGADQNQVGRGSVIPRGPYPSVEHYKDVVFGVAMSSLSRLIDAFVLGRVSVARALSPKSILKSIRISKSRHLASLQGHQGNDKDRHQRIQTNQQTKPSSSMETSKKMIAWTNTEHNNYVCTMW